MTTFDDRRLWPGTRPPVQGAPDRRLGWVRRTTAVDLVRPEGFRGPLGIEGSGRDLVTGADGRGEVVAEARTRLSIDYLGTRAVTAVEADPDPGGLDALVGIRAGSGFRRAMAEVLPDLAAGGGLVHLLLDDVTPGTLISGSALLREGSVSLGASPSGAGSGAPVDICAGWQAGGAMLDALAETGVPLLGWGPLAPTLDRADDPLAWHDLPDLPFGAMRRRRLIDVGPATPVGAGAGAGEPVPLAAAVEVRFRDSFWERDGSETVVHEYRLEATVDVASWTFSHVRAVPGPLPAPECPSAAASADRLVGLPLAGLRDAVRDGFTGTSTCTHLNDVFRSLADVAHLWSARPGR